MPRAELHAKPEKLVAGKLEPQIETLQQNEIPNVYANLPAPTDDRLIECGLGEAQAFYEFIDAHS